MSINFIAQEAKRNNVYVKIFLTGTSGSGKSYSALRLATGMADEIANKTGTRPTIVLFNTEGTRGRYYANDFHYKIFPSDSVNVKQEEFTPQLYVEWTEYTIKHETINGVPPIIIYDTLTPAWDSMKAQQSKMGGTFKDWVRANPIWNDVKRMIVNSNAHMIVNARGKTTYEIDADEKGKKTVRKLGLGADMREGMDYEFTVSFNIDNQTHVASTDKDNTKIFGTRVTDKKLTEKDGVALIQWANTDIEQTNITMHSDNVDTKDDVDDVKEYITKIKDKIDNIINQCNDSDSEKEIKIMIANTIKKFVVSDSGKPIADYRLIKDIEIAKQVINELNNI